jgi:hypothetical protein
MSDPLNWLPGHRDQSWVLGPMSQTDVIFVSVGKGNGGGYGMGDYTIYGHLPTDKPGQVSYANYVSSEEKAKEVGAAWISERLSAHDRLALSVVRELSPICLARLRLKELEDERTDFDDCRFAAIGYDDEAHAAATLEKWDGENGAEIAALRAIVSP